MGKALALLFLTATVSVSADDADAKKELKKFQGTWEVVSVHQHGKDKDPTKELPEGYKITFRDDLWIPEFDGRKPFKETEMRLKLDPAKSPKEFEYIWSGVMGFGASDRHFRVEMPGIYEIDGDTLKLCWDVGRATGRRPTSFKTEAGTEHLSLVLKRVKAKK